MRQRDYEPDQDGPNRRGSSVEDWREDYARRVYRRFEPVTPETRPTEAPELGELADATGRDKSAGTRGV